MKKVLTVLSLLLFVGGAAAEPSAPFSLADFSLEELLNVKVTSVSKQEEVLNDAAAAIFVLSSDDIRRSGATTVVDALRLVPGMHVASVGSSDWAVSARGFNNQLANKLLVMIDGRTVYSPVFSGVYWDMQQVFLDDVDRIEVIRGPGATIWGANAVNGVINILSKSARETQGGLLYAGAGDELQALGGVRYGGKTGENTFYRVYGSYQLNNDFLLADGRSANDGWDIANGGFRFDHYTDNEGQLTWQGDTYAGNLADRNGDMYGFNLLGRWTQILSEDSSYEVQAYFDHTHRNYNLAEFTLDTADLTFQQTFGLGDHNDVIWGLGYRFSDALLHKANSPLVTIVDDHIPLHLVTGFIQNEFKFIPDQLSLTVGTKVEHNEFTGMEVMPSARLAFKPTETQTLWSALSRAVRTPSGYEGKNPFDVTVGGITTGPGGGLYVPTLTGNDQLNSEVLWAYELGYRVQPSSAISLDLAVFYNDYDHLVGRQATGFTPGSPLGILTIQPVNTLRGESYGSEALITVAATDTWNVSASYSLLEMHIHGEPISEARELEANAPTHQVVLRSSHELSRNFGLDAQFRYVDNVRSVPAYLTADLRVSYRPDDNLELSLVGRNLLDHRHSEQASVINAPTFEVPRGVYGRITWRF